MIGIENVAAPNDAPRLQRDLYSPSNGFGKLHNISACFLAWDKAE